MTRAAADMLTARLLWASPRVRWEAARGIARLVAGGNETVRDSLLDWIGRRTLESEVTLALGVIDGFGLGGFFDASELLIRIRVPSLLSDWLMRRNFGDAGAPGAGSHGHAPDWEIELPTPVSECFERYRRFAVPPIFDITLRNLEKATGAPLTERWRHEWRWLQSLQDRPITAYPEYFFSPSIKGEVGSYDGAQREVFASAFLRTLHWARSALGAPRESLERHSLTALTVNPGLARLEPRRRWPWARLVLPPSTDWRAEAWEAWQGAAGSVGATERPIEVNVVETDRTSFVEHRMSLVAVPVGSPLPAEGPLAFRGIVLEGEPHVFGGSAAGSAEFRDRLIDSPVALSQALRPGYWGRFHVDLSSEISILSPLLAGGSMEVEGRADDIVGRMDGTVVTRWFYWLAGWSPARPAAMRTSVPSLTSARRDMLERLAEDLGVRLVVWAQTRRGMRRDSYAQLEMVEESAWLGEDA